MSIYVRGALALLLVAVVVAAYQLAPGGWFDAAVSWTRENPTAGAAAYIAIGSLAAVAFVPGSVTMMLAGFLFGTIVGSAYALAAIVIGAQLAFIAGRFFARHWVEHRVHSSPRLQAIESAIGDQAFTIVLLTRLALLIPYNLLNYVYGVTSVRGLTYLRATAAGMLPVVVLYVYIGSLARNIGQVMSGEATPPQLAYWVAAAGLVGISAVTWLVHRAASRALRSRLQE
ncbi:MAG: TVP38/TMEM64 family protein [Woeseiaceae bacterium]|nr:TVP38/TMEM64 family protein [Woeseiaceae bacterium]